MLEAAQAFVTTLVSILGGTLATRAAEGITGAASNAWSTLVRVVRRRLGADSDAAAALGALEQAPTNEDRQQALVAALRKALTEDEAFAEQFRTLWQQAQVEIHAESGGVASQFSGAGTWLVQAGRDVTVNYLSSVDGPPAVPRQVPVFVGPFTNRLPELSRLDRHLTGDRSNPTTMVMVVGMPGVGKTALTRRGAAVLGDRFPGGHLYVDFATLAGRTGVGAAVSEAAACGLRAVGVDERFIPGGLTEQATLFRTRTAGRPPMLVVLDGVTEPAQVRPLIPSAPGSAVVVTTEYQLVELVKEGAQVVNVDPLPPAEAVSLLAATCGDDRVAAQPNAARAVAGWCGGLPEALRVAGARLALDPTVTVEELAEELADEAGRLEALSLPGWAATGVDGTVAAAFAVSYGRLPPPARELYRVLGVMPVPQYPLDLVQAVTRTGRTAVKAALETLVGASLLRRAGRDRYWMHPLVRLHAAQQATVDDPATDVVARVIDFYLPWAAWADKAIMGDRLRIGGFDPMSSATANPFTGPQGRRAALAAMEAERVNLLAVVRAAAEAGHDEPVWQLAQALTALYLNHRHYADWIETSRLGVEAAQRQARRDVQARLRSMVSRAYVDIGDLPAAREQTEAALRAAVEINDLSLRASVWEFYGRYLEQVDWAEAVTAYRTSLALNVEAGQERGAALARYFLGAGLEVMGRREEAMVLLHEARAWLSGRDERMAARCTYTIGLAHLHAASHGEADRELRAAAESFAAEQLWHYEVLARQALADLAHQTGDPDAERRELQRALHVEQAAGGLRAEQLRARLATLN